MTNEEIGPQALRALNGQIEETKKLRTEIEVLNCKVAARDSVVAGLSQKLESANQLNADMNKQRQEMIRRAYDAELQLDALRKAAKAYLDETGVDVLARSTASTGVAVVFPDAGNNGNSDPCIQNRLSVEGKPGDVCGPCGVAHPVAEKRNHATWCDHPVGTENKRCPKCGA
jgi:hypothetical protein